MTTGRTDMRDKINTVVLDFDGTLTDGMVYVSEDGRESVRCSRKDGHGIAMLRAAGIRVMVISKERNPVVFSRCKKLRIECHQGVDDKAQAMRDLVQDLSLCLYMGDDLPDLPAMELAALVAAPSDAHKRCIAIADFVTSARGGEHAVREMCEWLLEER